MLYMMTIKIDRKNLNESDNYKLDVTKDDSAPPVDVGDKSIIELLSEIIKVDNG